RNPGTKRWDVLNYEDLHTLDARTPADALRRFFGSPELGVIYRVPDPDGKAERDYFVASDHRATLTELLSRPGVDAALQPSFGHARGANEHTVPRGAAHDALGVSPSGLRVVDSRGGVTVADPQGRRLGFSSRQAKA